MILGMKLKKDYFEELERRLRRLEENSIKVGMFSNAKYKDTSYSYVSLFSYLSGGDPSNNMEARPVIELTMAFSPLSTSPLKKELTKYFSNINRRKGDASVNNLLKSVGLFYRNRIAENFGNTTLLANNTAYTQRWKEKLGYDGNKPLLMSGDLRSKISFKIEDSVWEYGK